MRWLACVCLLSASAAMADTTAPAPAPPPKPTIVRGVIETIDTTSIKIKTDAGGEVTAAITPMSRFAAVEARTLNQIKATDFVGITAVPGRNGHLRAEELHILPAAGGEGQYPWDHHPSNAHAIDMGSMTNGSVESLHKTEPGSMTNGTVGAVSGEGELTISYHGAEMQDGKCEGHAMPGKTGCVGTTIVDITPQTYIAAIVPAKLAEGKPGLAVFAGVVTDSAGRSILGSATFEKNGVKPEF